MNAAGAPQGNSNNSNNSNSRSQPNQQQQPSSPNEQSNNSNLNVLSPQQAALRGAAMAFSKQKKPPPPPPSQQQQQQQQQKQQQTRNPHRQSLAAPSPNHNQAPASPRDNGALSAATSATKTRSSPAGSVSGRSGNTGAAGAAAWQTAGNGGRLSRQTTGSSVAQERGGGEELERERERLALFLSSPGSEQQPRSPYHSSPAGGGGAGAGGNNHNNNRAAAPATGPRSASFIAATLAASRSASPNPVAQGGGENGIDAVRRSHLGEPANIRRRRRVGSVGTSSSEADFSTTSSDDHPDTTSLAPTTSLISMFEVTRRGDDIDDADPVKSSPDRRVERKAKPPTPKALKAVADEDNVAINRPEKEDRQSSSDQEPPALPERKVSASAKTRPEVPKKSTELPGKSPLELKRLGSRKLTRRPSPPIAGTGTDGQNSSKRTSLESTADARPSSAGSVSSNDSFVSASSTPTRTESPPVFDRASRSLVPRVGALRPASTLPPTPTLPVRRTPTGSSSLTLDSLSDAIVAGSLASARHPTAPTTGSGSSRTPPPIPPSRRKGKRDSVSSRRPPSPHRMKQTLRQPRSLSDDEEEKKPHHKKKLIGNKKHTHHEGSRSRWRNEITEREKKRYEAVWASNRGMFLVQGQVGQQQQVHTAAAHARSSSSPSDPGRARDEMRRGQVVRTESYEELSDYVPNVVVRDLWSRSRLPAAELAEVWDLVYGGTGGRKVHAALNKPEFVVGMWLVDQRLRGRKIPTRVSDSVWDSAKGLRVWSPVHGHPKGKGK